MVSPKSRRKVAKRSTKRPCARGTVRRAAYTKKSGIRVKASCIKDVGLPGKGKKLFTLKPGKLAKYGYSNVTEMSVSDRHKCLNKAIKAYGASSVIKKLNSVYLLNRNTNKKLSKIFKSDRSWVSSRLEKGELSRTKMPRKSIKKTRKSMKKSVRK